MSAFFFRKKGYIINLVSKSVRRHLPVNHSVTFHVNVSPPKTLEVATSDLVT